VPSATFWAVLAASSLACAITTLGILVISRYRSWAQENAVYFMSFGAGVLLTVSLMHLVPESLEMEEGAPMFWILGFVLLYLFNRFLHVHMPHELEDVDISVGVIPMLGILLHSLIDGVIYSVTFNVSIFTGALAAIGMILHEFPEGIITFVFLDRGGFDRRRAAIYAFLAAGLSTPLATLLSFPFIEAISDSFLGGGLAISAGALIYVGGSHLLPEVEECRKRYCFLVFLSGVLLGFLILLTRG